MSVCLCVCSCMCTSVSFCLSVSVCLCVCSCMCTSVSFCLSVSVCLCVCSCMCTSVSFCLSVSVCLCVCSCMRTSVSFCLCLYVCVCVRACVRLSLSVSLCLYVCVFVHVIKKTNKQTKTLPAHHPSRHPLPPPPTQPYPPPCPLANSQHPGVNGETCDLQNPFLEEMNRKWLNFVLKSQVSKTFLVVDKKAKSKLSSECIQTKPGKPLISFTSNLQFCLFVGCLTSQQHASVSQGPICSDNLTCCHTEMEVADQTFHLIQSQYADTGPTSPSTDPITPGAWQGSHWSANF